MLVHHLRLTMTISFSSCFNNGNGSITRRIHTRPIPASTIQGAALHDNKLAYFLAILDYGNVV